MNAEFLTVFIRENLRQKVLLDELAGTTPTRLYKEVADDRQPGIGRAFIVGPVNKHRATDDEIARHEPPVATVFTVIAVVAHHEITIGRHRDLIFALEDVVIRSVVFSAWLVVNVVELARLARRIIDDFQRRFLIDLAGRDVMFGDGLTVDDYVVALDANAIAGSTDHTLHVVSEDRPVVRTIVALGIEGIAGILEDDDVATLDLALRQKRQRLTGSKNELVDQQMIANRDRVLHRARRHLHRLHDERHAEEGHDHRYHG